MLTNLFGLLFAAVSLLILFISVRTLFSRTIFFAWLKGTMSFFGITLAVVAVFVSADLLSYAQVANERSIAQVSIEKLGPQQYQFTLIRKSGEQEQFQLKGDLWQLDVRLIEWSGMFDTLGMQTGYRMDRLSGRYYTLEQERNADRTLYDLYNKGWGTDLWSYASEHPWLPGIKARYGSATYLPLRDGAIYDVVLEGGAIKALPENDVAKQAVNDWN